MTSYSVDDVIGHERPLQALSQQLEQDTLAHTYFFQGPRGIGRFQVALRFSMQLLCEGTGAEKGSDTCRSCDLFTRGGHPDLMIVEVLEGKNSISIDQTKEAIQFVAVRPYMSSRKVVIIRDADDMTVEAQNSLLKTLEEPPAYAHFILLGKSQESLLDTVLSRCRVLPFSLVPRTLIEEYLTSQGLTREEQDLWLSFFGGEIGTLISVLNNPDAKQQILDEIARYTALLGHSPSERLNYVRGLGKLTIADVQSMCSRMEILWDLALLNAVSPELAERMHHPLIRTFIDRTGHCAAGSIEQVLASVVKLRQQFKAGMNAQLHMEDLFLNLPICLE